MARTPEQVLREIVAGQTFTIAQLQSEIETSKEENEKLKKDVDELNKKMEDIVTKLAETKA